MPALSLRPELARRIVWEAEAVHAKYPGRFRLARGADGLLAWEGTVPVEGRDFPVVVTYPAAYPAVPAVDLTAARVAVLGCGSVGGLAAWGCAAAGVGSLILADRDRLLADNVRRHACGRGAVGRLKTAAVARFLTRHFPALHTTAH